MDLTAAEGRVLGCLIEREAAAPQAYPVTLNDLRLACNQTMGRDPVVAYDDRTVEDTLLALKSKGLARFVPPAQDERTTRYRHRADERWRLGPGDLAVLAVLLLRGAQTVSEVRDQARRLAPFADPTEVDAVLDMLAARTPTPFAARLDGDVDGGAPTRWVEVLTGRSLGSGDPGLPVAVAERSETLSPTYAELAARIADLEKRLAEALERRDRPGGPDDPANRPTYRSRDWRDKPVPPPPPPPPVAGSNHVATVRELTFADERPDLAERLTDIERRLARIEAELAALH
jgi:uncharacterized protein